MLDRRLPVSAVRLAGLLPVTLMIVTSGCGGGGIVRTKAADLPASLRGGHVVEGVVYLDVNANGWRDQSEPLIPDLPILLDGSVHSVTNACGQFAFSGLSMGFHRVSVDPAEMPAVYAGAHKVSQNIRAGKETAKSLFEVAVTAPKSTTTIVQRTTQVIQSTTLSPAALAAALEAEKAKALVAIKEVAMQLDRIKASGFAPLVKDTVTRIEGAIADAHRLIEIGDPGSALRLATGTGPAVEEARKRIESETQRPLRW